jgi:glutaredoxin
MGRVTIFSLSTCPHCKRAKSILTDHNVEYYEISLTEYPEKRTHMLQLADLLTVPQIFFNAVHIGGALELQALEASGKLAAAIASMQSEPDPDDPRLARPDYAPKPEPKEIQVHDVITRIADESLGYAEVNDMLVGILDIQDRTNKMKTFPKCFLGSQAVQAILARYEGRVANRREATQLLCGLEQSGFFEHVTCGHSFKDEPRFYRLQIHAEPSVLNSYRNSTTTLTHLGGDPVALGDWALQVLKQNRGKMSALQSAHMDRDGMIDYGALRADRSYRDFHSGMCELQVVPLHLIPEVARLAVLLNVYNLCILHAFAQVRRRRERPFVDPPLVDPASFSPPYSAPFRAHTNPPLPSSSSSPVYRWAPHAAAGSASRSSAACS